MEEEIRETTKRFLNNLKENNSKPENIYDYNTFVLNGYLIPLYNAVDELINKNKEQQKIIELMAKDIAEKDIDEDICKKVGKNPFCDEYGEESKCVECVIEYYKKKALEV